MAQFAKDFFALQLDFAQVLAAYESISFTDALFKYTTIYNRLIGFSDFEPPSQNNPRWLAILANWPQDTSAALEYVYALYQDFEAHKPSVADERLVRVGCFSYSYLPEKNMYALHFNNVDPAGNLGKDRVPVRMKELKELFLLMKQEQRPTAPVYVTTWLLTIEAFNRLFPAAFVESKKPRNKGMAQDNGWWGQFIDKNGMLKVELAEQLRENMKSKRELVDEYFPLRTMRAEAPQRVLEEFYW